MKYIFSKICSKSFIILTILNGLYVLSVEAQSKGGNDSLLKNNRYQPHDSVYNRQNVILEFVPITAPYLGIYYRAYTIKVGVGVFVTRRFSIGFNFYPAIEFESYTQPGFSWQIGPYIRYHVVFKRNKKEIKWFSMAPMLQYGFGMVSSTHYTTPNATPNFPPAPPNTSIYHTVSVGIGWYFRIRNQWGICADTNFEFGPAPRPAGLFVGVGFNYIFKVPVKRKK